MQYRMLQRGSLHTHDGRLIETGYATSLIKTYDRARIKAPKWRIKEWDYYLVASDSFALALTVADNGYMGLDSVSLMDFDVPSAHTASRMSFFPMGKKGLPATSQSGSVRAHGKGYELTFKTEDGQRQLYGHMYDFTGPNDPLLFDIVLSEPKQDSMVIVTPFAGKPRAFYYNQKINCMPAQGRVIHGEKEYIFSPASSFGTLDWGRGVWTYSNTWYWGSASGIVDGLPFGMNLGYGFGDTSAATENMLFYGGVAYKLEQVIFDIPMKGGREDWLSPWQIKDDADRLNLRFDPIIDRYDKTDFKLLSSVQHQVFGRFSGWAQLDGSTRLNISNLTGFAEKVSNKW